MQHLNRRDAFFMSSKMGQFKLQQKMNSFQPKLLAGPSFRKKIENAVKTLNGEVIIKEEEYRLKYERIIHIQL
jgi:hypothetical protein